MTWKLPIPRTVTAVVVGSRSAVNRTSLLSNPLQPCRHRRTNLVWRVLLRIMDSSNRDFLLVRPRPNLLDHLLAMRAGFCPDVELRDVAHREPCAIGFEYLV